MNKIIDKNKIDIYIDFECINQFFASQISKNEKISQIPFAYSIGYIDKLKKTSTKFRSIDFQELKNSKKDIIHYLKHEFKNNLIQDIKEITNNQIKKFNLKTINFVGWNPTLDSKCLNEFVFVDYVKKQNKNIEVVNLCNKLFDRGTKKKREISLSFLTNNSYVFKDIKYWTSFKVVIQKELKENSVNKLKLLKSKDWSDGAVAAFCGAKLYNNVIPFLKKELNFSFSSSDLQRELEEYSLDDINRMLFIVENKAKFENIVFKISEIDNLKDKNRLNNQLISLLNEHRPELKIKDLIKKMLKENEDIKLKIDKITKIE